MHQGWQDIGIAYLCIFFGIGCSILYRRTRYVLFRLLGILAGFASLLFATLAILQF